MSQSAGIPFTCEELAVRASCPTVPQGAAEGREATFPAAQGDDVFRERAEEDAPANGARPLSGHAGLACASSP